MNEEVVLFKPLLSSYLGRRKIIKKNFYTRTDAKQVIGHRTELVIYHKHRRLNLYFFWLPTDNKIIVRSCMKLLIFDYGDPLSQERFSTFVRSITSRAKRL